MPAQGFACDAADVAAIGGAYALAKKITIGGNTSRDAAASPLPSSGFRSHIDIKLLWDGAGVAPTSATFYLAWDSAGDVPASAETTVALVAGLTTTNVRAGSAALSIWPVANSDTTTPGTIYMFLKQAGAGATVTTKMVRLYWRDHLAGV